MSFPNVHNTRDVLFRLCANADPQPNSIFTKGPADVPDLTSSEIATGSKLGMDEAKKLPRRFQTTWPPLTKIDAAVKTKEKTLFSP